MAATTRRKRKSADVVAVENLVESLFEAQATLNGLACPVCKCRRLVVTLTSHVGILVQCEGMDDGPQASEDGECTYDFLVRRVDAPPSTKLISLSFDGATPDE